MKKSYVNTALVCSTFIAIFFASVIPLQDPDIWFHLKSGEIIATRGIIHTDVFSFSAAGREWFPYEWLFQWFMYEAQQLLGLGAIPYIIAAIVTIQMGIWYKISHHIFDVPTVPSLGILIFFYISIAEFISARPHIVAYTILLAELYVMLLYTVKRKNWLWITIPLTLIWANFHGSIFLSIALFGAYGLVNLTQGTITKSQWHTKAGVTLLLWSAVSGIVSILPPLWITQYRLLWIFWNDRLFISRFIDEWTPLSTNPFAFRFVSGVTFLICSAFTVETVRNKQWKQALFIVPVLPFLYLMYEASRNVYLGYITLTLMAIWIVKMALEHLETPIIRTLYAITGSCIVIYYASQYPSKRFVPRLYYPVKATQFIKDNHMRGHMFNEYGYGGYMLYHLYPDIQIFYDGRTDVYLCCEMRDTMDLAVKKNLSDTAYKIMLDSLWKKYDISYVVSRPQKHSVLRKMSRILTDDPDWYLIYWDDDTQIFAKKDGKNDALIEKYGATAATPYNRNPFRDGMMDMALSEYTAMQSVVDSAKSRNAIGYIYLKKGKIFEAIPEFQKAMTLDPTYESPFMNLAEVALAQGDREQAIEGYRQALALAPDRGLIYIRLGQLYIDSGDAKKALQIWKNGIEQTVDADAKKTLEELVKSHGT